MGEMILAATSKPSSGSSGYLFLFVIIAVLVLMYFVTIRPQRRRQQQVMQTQREIRPGQRVRTTAGMYATIVALDGDDVVLEVAPGVHARFLRRAIMEVLPDGNPGSSGLGETGEYEEPGEYGAQDEAGDEAAAPEDVTATAGEDETAAAEATPGETETPSSTGVNPDGGRPAGR